VGKLPIERQGSTGNAETRAGQAMMERVYGDFLKK
jgi:hypothetical protein